MTASSGAGGADATLHTLHPDAGADAKGTVTQEDGLFLVSHLLFGWS